MADKKERIVILGAGFGGFTLTKKLIGSKYDVVLIDRYNHHQFQPLFYQVAMAGVEPSSIVFPLRKAFQNAKNVTIRVAEIKGIDADSKVVITDTETISYDHLVVATGAVTNYFNNDKLRDNTYGLKSVSEALAIRNDIFNDLEKALTTKEFDSRQALIDIAIVGGGPTGVELAGALAEIKKYILPKDYRELDADEVDIYLIQGGDRLLIGFSDQASENALKFLESLKVKVLLNTRVVDIENGHIKTMDGQTIVANKVIWAAGITCDDIPGIPKESIQGRNQVHIDEHLEVVGLPNVYAIGDASYLQTDELEHGHPQVAQVAIQMAKHLAKRFKKGKTKRFIYNDKGSLATIGRNKAVADLPFLKISGFIAWILWLVVHVASLIGFKNKLFVLINWGWNYITYDQSLRLIIKPVQKTKKES